MRVLGLGSCCAIAAFALAGCSSRTDEGGVATAAPGTPPDIILVSIDSLRPDHLGCYGYAPPTSPTIDRLAREGVRCATAVSTTSWTLPAHAAMFTGMFDSAHGLVDNGLTLSPAQHTLAEVLRERGYQTAGFYGGPYLHPTFGLDQGFDHYQSCMTTLPDDAAGSDVRKGLFAATNTAHRDITGPRTLQEVSRWLDTADARPFFCFIHLWDVHYDYIPPPKYVQMFDPDYKGTLTGDDMLRNPAIGPTMNKRDAQHLVALYDGEIRATDDILGEILAKFEAKGRLAHTLLVVTADHGEEFFEHGGKGHQRSLFEEVIRVPLIFRWPGLLDAGRVVTEQVRLVDLMPTIVSLASTKDAPGVLGRDISTLLRGGTMKSAPALCELLVDKRDMRGWRSESSKVITFNKGRANMGFDLARDPHEQHPFPEGSPLTDDGLKELRGLLASTLGWADANHASAVPVAVGSEIDKRLKGLGYTGDENPADPTRKSSTPNQPNK